MPFYEPTEKMFKEIQEQLQNLTVIIKEKQKMQPEDLFCDNQEFLQIMNISKRLAQSWRDTGFIGYSQLGNKIYYRLIDIQNLLNANYNPKK
jgi:3-methyladenine DNA glycosylase Tag